MKITFETENNTYYTEQLTMSFLKKVFEDDSNNTIKMSIEMDTKEWKYYLYHPLLSRFMWEAFFIEKKENDHQNRN